MPAQEETCTKCGKPINLKRDAFMRDPEKGLLCPACFEPQKAKHSSTPWHAEPEEASGGRGIAICSAAGDIVATITPDHEDFADAIDWANAGLITRGVNSHKDLVAAYEPVETAFLDALHALNDAGLACPASLGLAMERLRQVVANAKKKGND